MINFIFGIPRSGTTWLWGLLESHKETIPYTKFGKNDGKYSSSESGIYLTRVNQKQKLSVFAKKNNGKVIFEKTPDHIFHFSKIIKDFPNSKNVLIIRHPLGVLNSMLHSDIKFLKKFNIDSAIIDIKKKYKTIDKILKHKNTLIISYDDLTTNTKENFSKVLEHLNLDLDNIDEIINANKQKSKVDIKDSFRIGKSKSYLTELTKTQLEVASIKLKNEIKYYEDNRNYKS